MTAMTCERFEAILPDYFEGDLTDEAKVAADAHATTCESCRTIVADIDRITRDAAALPGLTPSRDLWTGIEERISATVLPLEQPAHRTVRRFGAGWMAAAATALIVTTAGITYLATSRQSVNPPAKVAAVPTKPVVATVDSILATSTVPAMTVASKVTPDVTPSTSTASVKSQPASLAASLASNAGSRRTPAANATRTLGSIQADAQYAHEIDILEKMVNAPTSGLDPATVQVVKKNLQVIDDAIAQSKAALVKDPASALLYNQITRAMGKKVELLRTMVSLSSST